MYNREDKLRQQEQLNIRKAMSTCFKNKNVLEVACGTGYWTQFVHEDASHVTSIDASLEVLSIAKAKNMPANKVSFLPGDAYNLKEVPGSFDAGLANFWFSHIPKSRIREFLLQFHLKLGSGATVFIADNMYLEAVGGTLIKKQHDENTYKLRTLENGTKYEIIKNYYDEQELRAIFSPFTTDLEVHMGACFWWVTYKTS